MYLIKKINFMKLECQVRVNHLMGSSVSLLEKQERRSQLQVTSPAPQLLLLSLKGT